MRRITLHLPWPLSGPDTREILFFGCQVFFLSYLGFLVVENLDPGFITPFFDFNIFLWATIIFGLLSSLWSTTVDESPAKRPVRWQDYFLMIVLAFSAFAAVFSMTDAIGWQSRVIAPLSGLVVLGLSLMVYYAPDDDDGSTST